MWWSKSDNRNIPKAAKSFLRLIFDTQILIMGDRRLKKRTIKLIKVINNFIIQMTRLRISSKRRWISWGSNSKYLLISSCSPLGTFMKTSQRSPSITPLQGE